MGQGRDAAEGKGVGRKAHRGRLNAFSRKEGMVSRTTSKVMGLRRCVWARGCIEDTLWCRLITVLQQESEGFVGGGGTNKTTVERNVETGCLETLTCRKESPQSRAGGAWERHTTDLASGKL